LSGGTGLGSGRTGQGGGSTLGRGQSTDTSALAGGAGGGQPLLEGVRITADQTGNTVLIYASTENYQVIARTLVQLDRPQLQVAIDATRRRGDAQRQPFLRRAVLSSGQAKRGVG